jgi:hypothetical protein
MERSSILEPSHTDDQGLTRKHTHKPKPNNSTSLLLTTHPTHTNNTHTMGHTKRHLHHPTNQPTQHTESPRIPNRQDEPTKRPTSTDTRNKYQNTPGHTESMHHHSMESTSDTCLDRGNESPHTQRSTEHYHKGTVRIQTYTGDSHIIQPRHQPIRTTPPLHQHTASIQRPHPHDNTIATIHTRSTKHHPELTMTITVHNRYVSHIATHTTTTNPAQQEKHRKKHRPGHTEQTQTTQQHENIRKTHQTRTHNTESHAKPERARATA